MQSKLLKVSHWLCDNPVLGNSLLYQLFQKLSKLNQLQSQF